MELSNYDRQQNRFELYNTLILAIATLAVTWCSYQGSLWNGIQTFDLVASNKNSRLAQQLLIQSGQNKAMEEAVIINFVSAAYDKDSGKVNYILLGLRPDLAMVLTKWLQSHPFENKSAPRHPMVMPEYESLMQNKINESTKLSEQSQKSFDEAQKANTTADSYSLLAVIFSMVMFLGAV